MAVKSPTASQMHALQLLREGDLIWNSPNSLRFQRAKGKEPRPVYAEPVDERIQPSTARVLVRERWIELKGFNPREGVYQLSASGRALTELLCECAESEVQGRKPRKMGTRLGRDRAEHYASLSGVDPTTTNPKVDWMKERLLCKKCWRLARCEARFFKHPHGANRYVWGIGPICAFHVDNPNRR
jgi:hypothetical protein